MNIILTINFKSNTINEPFFTRSRYAIGKDKENGFAFAVALLSDKRTKVASSVDRKQWIRFRFSV